MPFQQILDGAQATFEEVEELLDKIEAGEISVAQDVEAELREIFMDLADGSEFKRVGAVLLLSFASRKTQASRRKALRRLGKWAIDAERRFRVANVEGFRLEGKVLAEMRDIQTIAVQQWADLVRIIGEEDATEEEITEGKALSVETARLRKKFGDFNQFLADITGQGSTGKVENIIALINRGVRDANNFLDEFTRGAPLGTAGEVEEVEGRRGVEAMVDRAVESTMRDLTDFMRRFQFNRNTLSLSATNHARGVFNASTIALAQSLGVPHFMGVVTKRNRLASQGMDREQDRTIRLGSIQFGHARLQTMLEATSNIRGEDLEVTRKEEKRRCRISGGTDTKTRRACMARMIRESEPANRRDWLEVFAEASRDRQLQIPFGSTLGLHPGSRLFYLPVPSSVLADARALSRAQRKAA